MDGKMNQNEEIALAFGIVILIGIVFVFRNFISPIKTDPITLVPKNSQAAMINGGNGGSNLIGGTLPGFINNQARNTDGSYQSGNSGLIYNGDGSAQVLPDAAYNAGAGVGDLIGSIWGGSNWN